MSQRYIGGLIYNPPGGFSGYFDGSGDFLTLPSTSALAFGTGDFTVEMWVYTPAAASTQNLFTNANASTGGDTGFGLFIINTTQIRFASWNTTFLNTGSNAVVANQWNHIAVSRSGTTASMFVNGIRQATGTVSNNFSSTNAFYVGTSVAGGDQLTGYISNLRAVKGTAVYDPTQTTITVPSGPLQAITNTSLLTCAYPTFRDGSSNNFTITVNGNTAVSVQNPFPLTQLPNPALGNQGNGVYTMSQYQALRSQNLWPAIDPYFDYVTLMLHGNGTNGAQNNTFLDSSTNNFTITRNGNTTQGTFTPYGSNWSNYFNGTDAWLSIGSNAAFGMGTGDCTIECWYYPLNSTSGNQVLVDLRTTNTAVPFALAVLNGTGAIYAYNGTVYSGAAVTNNAWNHVAFVRNGSGANNCKLYLNGSQVAQFTDTSNWGSAQTCAIGRNTAFNGEFAFGYISNVRIVKGSAVYSGASFTPPTAPLTAITNTSLLTCADNRFIDDSSNNFSITINGSPSVQRFSPFAPTAPYAAGTIGGSGYFDGSGDWLNTSSSLSLSSGTDFTLEFWLYPFAAFAGNKGLVACNSTRFGLITEGGSIYFLSNSTEFDSNVNPIPGAWNHIALTRTSGTIRLFLNGAQIATASSNTDSFSLQQFRIGNNSSGEIIPESYISDVRWATTSFYSSNFTPPTAPLAAVTNTQLLLSYTNGGIIDNAMMNDLETVGNAQISTSVSKFGGGSLYFDGNGDYLRSPTGPIYQFGSGDLTIEMWFYQLSRTAGEYDALFRLNGSGTGFNADMYFTVGAGLSGYALTVSNNARNGWAVLLVPSGGLPAINTWHHLAVVRSGSTWTVYLNGVSVGAATYSGTVNTPTGPFEIGWAGTGDSYFDGYIDEFRITRGYARYTANFTPQRSQWQDQ